MLKIKDLGRLKPYKEVWDEMKSFTIHRQVDSPDECWLLEHEAVYTQGQAGKPDHLLNPGQIPVIQTDRGGQITYHGPGQFIVYFLMDLRRRKLGIRSFVHLLEQTLIDLLSQYTIFAERRCAAPGIYVDKKKIASLGLRVKNGCTYHGIALNVSMDLTPFLGINPCGFQQLEMTQMQDFVPQLDFEQVKSALTRQLELQ